MQDVPVMKKSLPTEQEALLLLSALLRCILAWVNQQPGQQACIADLCRQDQSVQTQVLTALLHTWMQALFNSYLVGVFDVFILLHIWQNCVCFGDLFTSEDTLWFLPWGISISLAFNPGPISFKENNDDATHAVSAKGKGHLILALVGIMKLDHAETYKVFLRKQKLEISSNFWTNRYYFYKLLNRENNLYIATGKMMVQTKQQERKPRSREDSKLEMTAVIGVIRVIGERKSGIFFEI